MTEAERLLLKASKNAATYLRALFVRADNIDKSRGNWGARNRATMDLVAAVKRMRTTAYDDVFIHINEAEIEMRAAQTAPQTEPEL